MGAWIDGKAYILVRKTDKMCYEINMTHRVKVALGAYECGEVKHGHQGLLGKDKCSPEF